MKFRSGPNRLSELGKKKIIIPGFGNQIFCAIIDSGTMELNQEYTALRKSNESDRRETQRAAVCRTIALGNNLPRVDRELLSSFLSSMVRVAICSRGESSAIVIRARVALHTVALK